MVGPYEALATALAGDGIRCQLQSPGQMVISQQVGPIWPGPGNSFWVTHLAGTWYVFTWAPVGYRVPDSADVAALCRTCMSHGERAMGDVPAEVVQEFGLTALSEEEAGAAGREMEGGAAPGAAPDRGGT